MDEGLQWGKEVLAILLITVITEYSSKTKSQWYYKPGIQFDSPVQVF